MTSLKLVTSVLLVLVTISSTFAHRRELLTDCEFDVTSPKYGGKEGVDIKVALETAFADACASPTLAKVIIPKGVYPLKEAEFKGPCKAPVEMNLMGTLQAPEDTVGMTKPDTWVGFLYLNDFTLTGGGVFDGQGAKAWKANDCHVNDKCAATINIRFHAMKKSLVKDITSLNSKNFHINVIDADGLTFDHVTVTAPGESVNTDGIHIGRSKGVNITDTTIGTGDDCISIGDGTTQLNVERVTCGPGHGISVGSLGKYDNEANVCGIKVKNCTLTDTQNGVRLKTWPSGPSAITVTDVQFEDIIVNNVENPIVLDQMYCPYNQCDKTQSSKIKFTNVGFKNIKGTSKLPMAVKINCSPANPCEQVVMSDIDIKMAGPGEVTSECTNVKPTITNVPPCLACGGAAGAAPGAAPDAAAGAAPGAAPAAAVGAPAEAAPGGTAGAAGAAADPVPVKPAA